MEKRTSTSGDHKRYRHLWRQYCQFRGEDCYSNEAESLLDLIFQLEDQVRFDSFRDLRR